MYILFLGSGSLFCCAPFSNIGTELVMVQYKQHAERTTNITKIYYKLHKNLTKSHCSYTSMMYCGAYGKGVQPKVI